MQGLMQDYPLTLPHFFDRAKYLFPEKEIVTATAVGFVMFAELPDAVTWLGILVIVASGVYIAVAGRPIKLPLLARSRTPSA